MVSWAPRPLPVFLFIALYLAPMLFNLIFHAGTSYLYRSYSRGLVSALLLFPALYWCLILAFAQAGLLRTEVGMLAAAVAAIVHTIDLVGSAVFPRAFLAALE